MYNQSLKNFYRKFVSLTEQEWQLLFDAHTIQEHKKGELLSNPGEPGDAVYFIVDGATRFYYKRDEKDYIAGFCFEQGYVGDYKSVLTGQPSYMHLEALEDTITLKLTYADIQRLYKHSDTFLVFGRLLAENLFIELSSRIESHLFETPEEKYTRLIDANSPILQRVPQYMIASYIGVTPETLSRIRRRMVHA